MCDFKNKITGKKPFTIVFTHKSQHGFQDIGVPGFSEFGLMSRAFCRVTWYWMFTDPSYNKDSLCARQLEANEHIAA
jgi:hypothetical protein